MSKHGPRMLVPGVVPTAMFAIGVLVSACRLAGADRCWPVLSVFRDRQGMSFATAVCFVFFAGTLYCTNRHNGRGQLAARLSAAFVLLAMGWQLAGHTFGFRGGLESLMVQLPGQHANPGPSVGTMLAFIGLSLWALLRETKWAAGDRFTGAGVMILGGMGVLGHITGNMSLAFGDGDSVPMAVHTALLFVLAGWGVIKVSERGHHADKPHRIALSLVMVIASMLGLVVMQRIVQRLENRQGTSSDRLDHKE